MPTITLTKEEALDILDSNDVVRDEVTGTSRWSTNHEVVFRYQGKLYRASYSVGATEQQDEGPWEYKDTVLCTEVEAYERTVTDYRPVPDALEAKEPHE